MAASSTDTQRFAGSILLVSGQSEVLRKWKAVLDNPAHCLVTAGSGPEALDRLEEREFAVIVMDAALKAPGFLETAREIRKLPRSRRTPIIALTPADDGNFPAVAAFRLGGVDCLPNPPPAEVLRAKVAGFVGLRAGPQRPPADDLITGNWLLERLGNVTPDIVLIDDIRQGRNVYANRALGGLVGASLRTCGLSETEFHRLVHPEDVLSVEDAMRRRRALADGEVLEHEYRLRCHDGGYRLLNQREVVFARNADGAVQQVLAVARDIGAARATEESLRASEERLELALESARLGSWDWDIRTSDLVWTRHHASIFGYEPATGRRPLADFLSRVHPDDLPRLMAARRRALEERNDYQSEYRVCWPDGTIRWVQAHGRFYFDAQGRPARSIGIVADTTDRRLGESALRESEERLSLALDAAHLGLWDWDVAAGTVRWNRYHEMMFGYEPGQPERTYQEFAQRVHPDDLPAIEAGFQRAMTQRQEYRFEHRVVWPDGTIRWVDARGRFHYDGSGRPIRSVGILSDVTERKQTETALKESERRLRAIIDNWPSIIFVKDTEGRYLLANRACESYSCLPPEEMIGKTDFDFLPHDYAERFHADDVRILRKGKVERYEEEAPIRGQPHSFLTVKFPLVDSDGQPYGVCGIATDVSDLKRAQQALVEADQRKDEFLAMLAHELRNPLAPIRNAAQVLRLLQPATPEMEKARQIIERQIAHLARLVDDLLDMSRISRGKILLRKKSVNLVDLVRVAAEDHRGLLAESGVHLQLDLAKGPLTVLGDPTRLAQIVGNLLHNAAKFTDSGGNVLVSLAADPDKRQAVLTVRDSGIGMSADMIARLFEPFRQADRSLDRSRGGLGVGLALVKGLVELHDGAVTGNSAGLGQGSEFVIRLPLTESAMPDAGVRHPGGQGGRCVRVLVIEDSSDSAESLRMLLELSGHVVAVAHSGREGVELARSFGPDAVLCDIGLPGMNGYAVARALREGPDCSQAKLIALTGYGQDEDRQRARAAGFDQHLTKPVDPAVLAALLAECAPGTR